MQSDPETGANKVWMLNGDGEAAALSNLPGSVRSRVNGYGGGALTATQDGVFVVSDDQSILFAHGAGQRSQTLTTDTAAYGGLVADPLRRRVLAVRETGQGVIDGRQQLVSVGRDGSLKVLHQGEDFYGAPALSDDGRHIAWISWQLPDMPWIQTRLWTARVSPDGTLEGPRVQPAPRPASIQQPVFSGQELWVLSDHDGWWQPWKLDLQSPASPWEKASVPDRDHANAPWQLAEVHHCPLPGGGWARTHYHQGRGELWLSGSKHPKPVRVAPEFSDFRSLCACGGFLYAIGRSPDHLDAVLRIDPTNAGIVVVAGGEPALPGHVVAHPTVFQVPALGQESTPPEGFLYLPLKPNAEPLALILVVHGGPTSAAYPVFNPLIQFWCQRGFAVAEVNYRGSSGYGRAFRLALAECWGDIDVQDMARAAEFLKAAGYVNGKSTFIQGRSSGGYTALMALSQDQRYEAGASQFGVTDPLQLRRMTHRFESGYLDWLLGNPEDHSQRWQERTPRLRTATIASPVIFFQGGQDKVVVPEQTRMMVEAMQQAGLKPELHWFPDEGHGILKQVNQAAMLEALYSFYQQRLRTIG
ncbi:prolyl oligopeptidase family serine peptidase [Marinobacter sp. 1_MG-2023]|uniref:S9 family peptidase n=1 Tax=Marinobacter sp. 1_MG-2023 TaxID=3062627 RepID=UPI0026E48DBE|nr:prolyl oligopeptidase family serine peptidase [Marinobacter sp. 1_MG-2023]MDO6825495.1 prolyl oligopeptidase family serine peptidase [Marinobacter sp. 1_MG-2023]